MRYTVQVKNRDQWEDAYGGQVFSALEDAWTAAHDLNSSPVRVVPIADQLPLLVDDRPRPDLVPPVALLEVGRLLAAHMNPDGSDPERWKERGAVSHLQSATRHVLAHLAGQYTDRSGFPHLTHAAARMLYALQQHLAGKP